jgi:alpha-amylase/alpha-mannosidase (GH57 family)
MAEQAFCIHGHFYQPPREDPLTGEIPVEQGAAPYRNWNERIHAQCYYPNALLGNFERISFNIGPTILEWMFDFDPETENRIIEQARKNYEANGVSNAIAQAYNHTILPLSSRRDKVTQVRWGIADFELRFGYKPQGMWLPETAADDETLEVLAEYGIQFTILAPWQGDTQQLDASHPYRVPLSSGKEIAVFFYDQDMSTRVSFDPASTINADKFLNEFLIPKYRLNGTGSEEPQLLLIASDGELYGHHQKFRDKFLAYMLDGALKGRTIECTYPALWLQKHPPKESIRIRQNTSWSCLHGVKRWSGNCECTPHSEWKAAFRKALDRLGDALDAEYLSVLQPLLADPWELRHQYIRVIHGEVNLQNLVETLKQSAVSSEDLEKINLLLRAQYERQRMFTSCGWFFDDFDRIEPRNNVAYAAQAVWLTRLATGKDLSSLAQVELAKVRSWRSGLKGDSVFRKYMHRATKLWGKK